MRRYISSDPVFTDFLQVRILEGQKAKAKRAADRLGVPLAVFVRNAIDKAADALDELAA